MQLSGTDVILRIETITSMQIIDFEGCIELKLQFAAGWELCVILVTYYLMLELIIKPFVFAWARYNYDTTTVSGDKESY